MKKLLLVMALAMSFSSAFAQFGQLTSSGSERGSRKTTRSEMTEKENSKKGVASNSSSSSEDKPQLVFLNLNYTASFEYFDKGAYGFDIESINAKKVVGASFGFHTTAGIMDPASYEVSFGLTFATSVAKNKLLLYAPVKYHMSFPDPMSYGLSLTPTMAYRITDKFGVKAGLPVTIGFGKHSDTNVGLVIGAGIFF